MKKEEKEYCVICGAETGYFRNTPIEKRKCYVDGLGQVCLKCFSIINHLEEDDYNTRHCHLFILNLN